eukprot:GILJ01004568.1.p1 GENE.GILJ01004568.1~~GILJ01004568.1.p1  ORF type:complete len:2868 (+),score=508.60 GILJ01004568.1:1-8604(+)
MISAEAEVIGLGKNLKARGNVEVWLKSVETHMVQSLRRLMKKGIQDYDKRPRKNWVLNHAAQVVATVAQIMWSRGCEEALRDKENKRAMRQWLHLNVEQLNELCQLVTTDLTPLERRVIVALVTTDVHNRDIVQSLLSNQVTTVEDFIWQQQLRYYWSPDLFGEEDCSIRQVNARFTYGYEYMGATTRLVITPLTDRCWITITGALHIKLGAAPAGPAGTGKTESTKDLAKALGVYCVVFNCSDQIDYKMMAKLFSGLVQQGAWSCLDEFNRIDIEVLSVVAQQLSTVRNALLANADQFSFEGSVIKLDKKCGVFVTMNPGYAGRTELPDNLKILFRPVSMMIPDYALIAEIMLMAEGFADARVLSQKMVKLYKLSSEQLSQQDHYDFGMRAVKSVLVMAGKLKRADPQTPEDILLIRAMRDSNVPKFLEQDLPLFNGIIKDLFPSVHIPNIDYGTLQKSIEAQLEKVSYQKVASFVTKIIQLHETMIVRHGVMVVGQTMSGKSVVIETLAQALTQLKEDGETNPYYQHILRYILNPKSVTMAELYGAINLMSNEWHDGLIARLVRHATADTSSNRNWIVFDGPVDALWIENMNTVLDDSKMLCLPNGERIRLPSTMTMVFEVQDLAVASPATVSRCGMVYLEPVHLGWMPLVETWANKKRRVLQHHSEYVVELIRTHIPPTLKFIREQCKETVRSVDSNLVLGCLNLLGVLLTPERGVDVNNMVDGMQMAIKDIISSYFCFALIWSLGANLDNSSRAKFDVFLRRQLIDLLEKTLPASDTVYDHYVETGSNYFTPWADKMAAFTYVPNQPYASILVPTVDTTRHCYVTELLINGNCNVLLMGETGVGKTVLIQDLLSKAASDLVSSSIMFSAKTSSKNMQDAFETKLEKKRKNLLGPPAGKRMVVFIDDLNMPQPDRYGSQPPIELLRQCIDSNGFYDRKDFFFKNVVDTLFLAACAPPGGGRNKVTERLLRHFHMIWTPDLSSDSMKTIFSSILKGYLSHVANDLTDMANLTVNASVELFNRITSEMLPIPSKSHYTFNLRDLSAVFQGIIQAGPSQVSKPVSLVSLWLHESARVFRDRLVDDADRSWFDQTCKKMLQQYLNIDWPVEQFQNVLYGDFIDSATRQYHPIMDMKRANDALESALDDYNLTFNNHMQLVFFASAIQHICRICRVLRQPKGNALLVGVGGSGRKSLTRLAASIADCVCVEVEITRTYGTSEFKEDLKKILNLAGVKEKQVVFLFSDTQIVHEAFLEDINNLLNSGEVPNLFNAEETEMIITEVRKSALEAGKIDTGEVVLQHFVQLVRQNLHMVLCFSPVGDSFRNRCRQFPSLVNCCTIDWFDAWPEDALQSVANRYYSAAEPSLGINDSNRDALCRISVHIHTSVSMMSDKFYEERRRKTYTTPTSYLELIKLFTKMLKEKKDVVNSNIGKYKGGLQKLRDTNDMVNDLKKELIKLQPTLEKAAKDTEELLVKLEGDKKIANEAEALTIQEAAECAKTARTVQAMKEECERDLEAAMPDYRAAVKALNQLDKNSINEVRTFIQPPRGVQTVMEGVCILMGRAPTWEEARKLLSDMRLLETLREFDKDHIPTKVLQKLQKYMQDPDFHPDKVRTVSTAATCLCLWVRAIVEYAKVAKNIEPKKARLAESELTLKTAQEELFDKQETLRNVQERVRALEEQYQASMDRRAELEKKMADTKIRLDRAEKLLSGLGSESLRWAESAETLEKDLVNLIGNMIVSAGCVAYVGPFTASYRAELTADWLKYTQAQNIQVDEHFELERVLADAAEVREWNMCGLPADSFSIENGLLATRGRRWPLMIDPQSQANRWVKNMCKERGLQVLKLSDPTFLRTLENAIRYGQSVLLENVGADLDPVLEPILLQQVFRRGGQWLLHLGDQDIPYSDEFKLYLTTTLPNPHYLPEVCIKVTIINFTVTVKGLEDQLLVDVVRAERPDLEEQKDTLIVQISSDKKQLEDLEDKILMLLAQAEGDILDDEVLINTLAASKSTSEAIKIRMRDAETTAQQINIAREAYRAVAVRGSLLYFVVADMGLIDSMYQYSLSYFSQIFNSRLQLSEKAAEVNDRISILLPDITRAVYRNICRGLFEKDKLLFAFLIGTSILRNEKMITDEEWTFFILGSGIAAVDPSLPENVNPISESITASVWNAMLQVSTLPQFAGLLSSVHQHKQAWKDFFASSVPHKELPPAEVWDASLSEFGKLLLLKACREEKLVFAIRHFIAESLGDYFVESPPFDLDGAYEDSTSLTPIVFVLSPGADPISYLMNLAKAKGFDGSKFRMISLGQGQGAVAEKAIAISRQEGDWVCLQNCHVAGSWLSTLERILEETEELAAANQLSPDYRLFLTSMPSSKFPVSVLQSGIKLTNEPPKGLKASVNRVFNDISEKDYESCNKPRPFKKLLFALAFFHAVCIERKKFGAIGWNIGYEWMNSDLQVGIQQLRMYLDEQPSVPYDALNYMIAEVTYGGRVTDANDAKCMRAILGNLFSPRILEDDFKFSPSGVYFAPPEGSLESVKEYIQTLPLTDPPEVFGLHENADITFEYNESRSIVNSVISIQPKSSSGSGGKTTEDIVADLANDIQVRLPEPLDRNRAGSSTFDTMADGSMNALSVFLDQEMSRFNSLLSVISTSLSTLQKAIKGVVVMSEPLEEMFNALLYQKVPPLWERNAYPSLKPLGSWVNDLIKRVRFLEAWLVGGPPACFWLSGFFFPQGFLTAVLQAHARKTLIAIDTLEFRCQVENIPSEHITSTPPSGVYIHGLFIQGAQWDLNNNSLSESVFGELFAPMPVIWLRPVSLEEPRSGQTYQCPVYKTSLRAGVLSTTGHSTNFVMYISLPSKAPEERWIRRGVALLSQLDE